MANVFKSGDLLIPAVAFRHHYGDKSIQRFSRRSETDLFQLDLTLFYDQSMFFVVGDLDGEIGGYILIHTETGNVIDVATWWAETYWMQYGNN